MALHIARFGVSDFLEDLKPCSGEPFPKGPVPGEIAEAFGARCIPKLVDALCLPDGQLPPGDLERCLRLFHSHLAKQESKAQAVSGPAARALVHHLGASDSCGAVRALCCQSLGSMAGLVTGRAAIAANGGVAGLAAALTTCPAPSAEALHVLSMSADGNGHLLAAPGQITAALVDLLAYPADSWEATIAAVATLSGMLRSGRRGVEDALACGVPEAAVKLAALVLDQLPSSPDGDGDEEAAAAARQLLAVLEGCGRCLQQVSLPAPAARTRVRLAGGIEVLARMLVAPSPAAVQHAAAALGSIGIDTAAKVPIMTAAGPALVTLLASTAPGQEAARAAARAALLNSLEALDARRALEALMGPQERAALLGPLPVTPPDYRYPVALPPAAIPSS